MGRQYVSVGTERSAVVTLPLGTGSKSGNMAPATELLDCCAGICDEVALLSVLPAVLMFLMLSIVLLQATVLFFAFFWSHASRLDGAPGEKHNYALIASTCQPGKRGPDTGVISPTSFSMVTDH